MRPWTNGSADWPSPWPPNTAHFTRSAGADGKVVEVKSAEYSKGSKVRRLLRQERYDFILAIGDDTIDDDLFQALPRAAVTVKAGAASEYARYNLPRQADVLPRLTTFVQNGHTDGSVRDTFVRGGGQTVWKAVKNLLTNKKNDDEK